MSYIDIGYDENLNLIEDSPVQDQGIDPQAFENFTDAISGSKIQGGILTSPDGKVKLDLETGAFIVNNGVQELVRFGILPDGNVGLLIKDQNGNTLLNVNGNNNLIQSATGKMILDFVAENFSVFDDANLRVVKLGKL